MNIIKPKSGTQILCKSMCSIIFCG